LNAGFATVIHPYDTLKAGDKGLVSFISDSSGVCNLHSRYSGTPSFLILFTCYLCRLHSTYINILSQSVVGKDNK
jgi:hypothetical protein